MVFFVLYLILGFARSSTYMYHHAHTIDTWLFVLWIFWLLMQHCRKIAMERVGKYSLRLLLSAVEQETLGPQIQHLHHMPKFQNKLDMSNRHAMILQIYYHLYFTLPHFYTFIEFLMLNQILQCLTIEK